MKHRRFSPALVVSVIALVVAMSGSAVAAKLLTGSDIQNGTITGADLKDGKVTGRDVKNGSVHKADLASSVRRALESDTPGRQGAKGDTGAQGPKGDTGAQGPKGDKGDRGPAGPPTLLPADFAFTNTSARLTEAGVQFGRYADGGDTGGSARYDGAFGMKLKDITALAYTYRYSTSDDKGIGAPYLRVFLNGDSVDVVYDPTECATVTPSEDTDHTVDVLAADKLRSWDDIVADHGDDVVTGIYVTTGFAGGHDVFATLERLTVNDETFHFGIQ
jgi:hypothetical protein